MIVLASRRSKCRVATNLGVFQFIKSRLALHRPLHVVPFLDDLLYSSDPTIRS